MKNGYGDGFSQHTAKSESVMVRTTSKKENHAHYTQRIERVSRKPPTIHRCENSLRSALYSHNSRPIIMITLVPANQNSVSP